VHSRHVRKRGAGAAPNPRVQRTRPCASLRGSPLTRHPLGRRVSLVAGALLLASACRRELSERQAIDLVRMIPAFTQTSQASRRPIFVKVSDVRRPGTGMIATLSDRDAQISFYYYWVDAQGKPTTAVMHGNVMATWVDGRWVIDDKWTQHVMPTWPALPSDQVQ